MCVRETESAEEGTKARLLRFALRRRRHQRRRKALEASACALFLTCLMYIAASVLCGLGTVSGRPHGTRQADKGGAEGERPRRREERGERKKRLFFFSVSMPDSLFSLERLSSQQGRKPPAVRAARGRETKEPFALTRDARCEWGRESEAKRKTIDFQSTPS